MTCLRCKQRPRWRSGEWCADCIWRVCCSHYPKFKAGRWIDCVHGNALRRLGQ